MKKKLFFATIVITGIIAAFNMNAAERELGDINLQNIEMLSSGERITANCVGTGSLSCPTNGVKVYMFW